MSFRPPFVVGSTVTHPEICTAFQCGNMGGMRRSKRTNTLIIISDHTKALYDDKWYGDTLHYTGEGKRGDQTLTKNNRTLNESDHNGVEVHLFEVLHPTQYIYHGVVSLAGKPYQEDQADEDGVMRKVWMFPVKPAFPISVDSTAYVMISFNWEGGDALWQLRVHIWKHEVPLPDLSARTSLSCEM